MPKRGGSRGRKKPSLYDLSRQHVQPGDRDRYLKEWLGESDRAAAIVAAADVETLLVILLELMFGRLNNDEKDALFFRAGAPLANFSARIDVAYGLGLIDSGERDDLHRIRRVRNVFAHSVAPITFENERIASECSKFWYREVHYEHFDEMATTYGQPKL